MEDYIDTLAASCCTNPDVYPHCHNVSQAADTGHIDCLRYFHELNHKTDGWYPYDPVWCAARKGHLQCLLYLHQHGAPITAYHVQMAAHYNRLDCLQYFVDHDCLYDSTKKDIQRHAFIILILWDLIILLLLKLSISCLITSRINRMTSWQRRKNLLSAHYPSINSL